MTSVFRSLIEATLQGMEGGRFQDFCLEFLPLFNERFVGLSRVGHTADGKTRRGVPDLIKTDARGAQTAIQCGTQEDYWKPSPEYKKWKPLDDAKECLQELAFPTEIVLISNREVPPSHSNCKAELIAQISPDGSTVITPISLEEISQILSTAVYEPATRKLIKSYFPEVFDVLSAEEQAQKFQLANDVAKEREVHASSLMRFVDDAFRITIDPGKARSYVVERIDELLSSYRLNPVPSFSGIHRESVEELPLREPLGQVFVLTGVPKIGKTSLLRQLRRHWNGRDIHWYQCPVGINVADECAHTISVDLIRTVLPRENPEAIVRSNERLNLAVKRAQPPSNPTIFLIDDAQNLGDGGLRQISNLLGILKRSSIFQRMGFVFCSTRNLLPLLQAVDVYLSPPFWTASELGILLRSSEIPFDVAHERQYLEVLATFSGGHPLLAKALARRSPTIPDLIASEVESAPALADEDLSDEVRALLYEEILTNPDSQNLVQRLSVLGGGTSSDVVEALRTEVQPQVATTASLIIEQVGGSVIEGDSTNGYTVAFVFRKIAEQRISQEERQAVYRTAARTLLRPKGRILDAERTVWGILYAFCLGDFDQVFFWATNLLLAVDRQSLAEPILSALLLKLHFLTFIPPFDKFHLQVGHALMMCGFAAAHSRLKRYEDAANALENLRLDAVAPESDSELAQLMVELRFCVITYRAVLSAAARTGQPLQEISRLSTSDLASVSVKERVVLLEILPELVGKFPLADLSPELTQELINEVEAADDQKSRLLFRLAQSIGARAKDEHIDSDSLRKFFTTSPFGEMLWQVATATSFIESGECRRGLEEVNRAIEKAREIGSTSGGLWAYLHQLKGDAAYHEQAALALDSYRESLKGLEKDSFGHAWSGWRIGLLSSDEQILATSAEGFRALGHTEHWGRAWGARAAELIKSGKERQGVDCFLDLLDSYFLRKDEAVGPAVTIAQAHMTRLRHLLEGNPIPESDPAFPEIAGSPYELIPSGARPKVGPVTAFYSTALTYELLGDKTKAQGCLIKALNSDPANETDKGVLPLAIKMRLAALSDSDAHRGEIAHCIDLILACQSFDSRTTPTFLAFSLFHDADKAFNRDRQAVKLENIIDLLGEALLKNKANEEFWKSELTLRRGKLAFHEGKMTDATRLYREALQRGRVAKNGTVLQQAAHALGFELVNFSRSLKELGEQQFAFLEGVEIERNYPALNAFGQNLFHYWRKLEYRKLNVSDLDTKKYLMESAKAMDTARISPEDAGFVMILLLAKLFNYSGAALESARSRVALEPETLPQSVFELLQTIS